MLLQPAKQADKYVTPSAPQTGVKESVWHSQLLLQGEYGSRDEVGVELQEKQREINRQCDGISQLFQSLPHKDGFEGGELMQTNYKKQWAGYLGPSFKKSKLQPLLGDRNILLQQGI